MQSSPQSTENGGCPVCRAPLTPGLKFCGSCGTGLIDTAAGEILKVNYLLAELANWERAGMLGPEQATRLRAPYERRREMLRSQLPKNGSKPETKAPPTDQTQATPQETYYTGWRQYPWAPPLPQPAAPTASYTPRQKRPRRLLLETLADPQTIRLLLYTGAGMLVVGIIIWLRDVLYLKLQEPVVQATLLALGTLGVTAAGWLTILRTRLLLTGRALTLVGSLLVPVNFWFLVRSGLLENRGRAWVVCAFCTLLYAHTAALLREKLYVYLAGAAAVATSWTLIYSYEHEAYALYAVALMVVSLIFLHLSRLLPVRGVEQAAGPAPRLGYELWGQPLVQMALAGATLSPLLYMVLRLGSEPSFAGGILRLRAPEYDPSVGMLLFAMGAYAAWFTGRYVYTDRRRLFYTLSALALLWTEFLALDGLGVYAEFRLLMIAAAALAAALLARATRGDEWALPLHRAALIGAVLLSLLAYPALSLAPSYTLTQSAALFLIAATFWAASAPRFCVETVARSAATASAVLSSLGFLVALASLEIQSRTLFFAACSAWPFALYAASRLAQSLKRETQVVKPFEWVADAEAALLLLLGAALAFGLNQSVNYGDRGMDRMLGPMFSMLSASILYGALRFKLERSVFGAALLAPGLLALVGASGDTLKYLGALPAGWPVATAIVIAAFLLRAGAERALREETGALSRRAVIHMVADFAAAACAAVWFADSLQNLYAGGTGTVAVLTLALLYWAERAAGIKRPWPVYVSAAHAAALCVAVLVALRVRPQWFTAAAVLSLFPLFFAGARMARSRGAEWAAHPLSIAAALTATAAAVVSVVQAMPHLSVGEQELLPPTVALGAVSLISLAAAPLSRSPARGRYFRAGLYGSILTFMLACLRAGFDPVSDVELYTAPTALLLLAVAYLAVRKGWEDIASDASALLWAGSLLLSAPLLGHALQYRLLLGVPAPGRDLLSLLASLALILFGVTGRLRAPVLVGAFTLGIELLSLSVTSVNWLQVPLKVYLITVGALILLVWGMLEFRREQLLRLRQRLSERRDFARERFGEWK